MMDVFKLIHSILFRHFAHSEPICWALRLEWVEAGEGLKHIMLTRLLSPDPLHHLRIALMAK